jgi:hypothetical protein
VNMQ